MLKKQRVVEVNKMEPLPVMVQAFGGLLSFSFCWLPSLDEATSGFVVVTIAFVLFLLVASESIYWRICRFYYRFLSFI